jgi:drug/metabolite transporter (DMT)-like permease
MGSLAVCSLLVGGMSLKKSAGVAKVWLTRRVVVWAMGAVLLDTSGNLLFIAATRAGRLDVAAVLASLYPASTILLAAWMLRERPTRRQGLGMAVAAAAVVMITL